MAREKAVHKGRFFRRWTDADGGVCISAKVTPAAGARLLEAVGAKAQYFFEEARKTGIYEPMSAYFADALVSLADDAVLGNGTGIARPA